MAELLDELGYPREVTKKEVVSAFLQTIQRCLNCLSSDEQKQRRGAIEKLHVCLLKDDGVGSLPPMDILQEAWDEVILEKVLHCVRDSSEKCRELAIQLIREVAQSLTEVDCTLKETVPVIEERMGQPPVLEGSEEIRLQLYSLLIDVLLPECELRTLQNLIDPLHRIVAVTLFDQFHEVQKRACSVLVTLANRDPEVFGNKTGVFLRGLVPCLRHAHSRVRIAVFQAIDAMMQCGLTKSLVAQQLAPGTKSLAFDHNAAVRELFFSSVGNWLNFKLNTMTDEGIHECVASGKTPRFHLAELLPLLLLGITDDCIDIATLTCERLEGIGELYKKFIDHLDTRSTHGRGGQRFRTAEEDAKLMEKVMEEERKCQEKYERELREAEEQRRVQRDIEAGESSANDSTIEEETAQETSLYQSLKAQTSSMEEELNQAVLSAEKVLDTDLRLSNGPDKEFRDSDKVPLASDKEARDSDEVPLASDEELLDPDKDELPHAEAEESSEKEICSSVSPVLEESARKLKHEEPSDTITEKNDLGTGIQENKEENFTIEERSGASGLHILTNHAEEESSTKITLIPSQKKDTSEITDEGAVKKLDTGEAGVETLQLPKPWKGRANAGCRLMVEAFLRPMIEPALRELKQWTAPTRLSAARFLHTLMILAERLAKDNLDILIPAFFRAVGDDEVKVAKRVVATIHIIGFHVTPSNWLPLVLKPLDNKETSQVQRANILSVAAAFLYGTPRKAMEEKHVVKICDKLYKNEICCSNHSALQNQILPVMTNIIQVAGALCKSSSFKIFVLLLWLQSVEDNAELRRKSGQALEHLAQALGMESARELYLQHIQSLLDNFTIGHEGWSSSLQGKLIFQTFMGNASDIVGPHLESLMPYFNKCLESDQDPALRVSSLQLLDKLFEKQELILSWTPLAKDVLCKLLIPCAVGHASKVEDAVQYGAMVAIGTFLKRDLCSQEHLQELMKTPDGLMCIMKNCMDENFSLDVRRASTHVVYQVLHISGALLSDEERTDLIEILCKCMDNSSNLIQRAVLPAVKMFFTTMPPTLSNSEVQDFISRLALHLDDDNSNIQEGLCRAMEACVLKKPEIFDELLCKVPDHQRSSKYIDLIRNAASHHVLQ